MIVQVFHYSVGGYNVFFFWFACSRFFSLRVFSPREERYGGMAE